MRNLVLAATILAALTGPSLGQVTTDGPPRTAMAYGSGIKLCTTWLDERRTGTDSNSLQWVLGYLSAVNVEKKDRNRIYNDIVSGSADSAYAYIDWFCGQNPRAHLWDATLVLIAYLQLHTDR